MAPLLQHVDQARCSSSLFLFLNQEAVDAGLSRLLFVFLLWSNCKKKKQKNRSRRAKGNWQVKGWDDCCVRHTFTDKCIIIIINNFIMITVWYLTDLSCCAHKCTRRWFISRLDLARRPLVLVCPSAVWRVLSSSLFLFISLIPELHHCFLHAAYRVFLRAENTQTQTNKQTNKECLLIAAVTLELFTKAARKCTARPDTFRAANR